MTSTTDPSTRLPLRPIHVALIVVLVCVLGLIVYALSYAVISTGSEGRPAQQSRMRTTPAEAEAKARGQQREGVNPSQDSYTTQNQSRQPPPERR